MESAHELIHKLRCIKKLRTSEFLMDRNLWIKIIQALSMVWYFYFTHMEIFSWPMHFKNWKPLKCKSKKLCQIHSMVQYSVSDDNYIFFILLFVYTLICQQRDFTYKRETKLINILKIQFINDIANLQMLTIMKYEKNLIKKRSKYGTIVLIK